MLSARDAGQGLLAAGHDDRLLGRRGLLACALGAALPSIARARWRIVVMPKLVGIPYYDAVRSGVEEAARELPELDVAWEGPAQDQVEQQIALIERWIPEHPDLLAIAADDGVQIGPVLRRAQQAGIRVMSWDADCNPREFFVNLVSYEDFAGRVVDLLAAQLPAAAQIAIVTTSFKATNQAHWINAIKRRILAQGRRWRIVDIRPAGESTEEARRVTHDLLRSFPTLTGVIALGSPNLPGVATAVREAGLSGRLAVTGNSLPSRAREFIKDGTVRGAVLWNPLDHGYLTVHCAGQLLRGGLAPGQAFNVGRLGGFRAVADAVNSQVALPALVFDRDNVDRYAF